MHVKGGRRREQSALLVARCASSTCWMSLTKRCCVEQVFSHGGRHPIRALGRIKTPSRDRQDPRAMKNEDCKSGDNITCCSSIGRAWDCSGSRAGARDSQYSRGHWFDSGRQDFLDNRGQILYNQGPVSGVQQIMNYES